MALSRRETRRHIVILRTLINYPIELINNPMHYGDAELAADWLLPGRLTLLATWS